MAQLFCEWMKMKSQLYHFCQGHHTVIPFFQNRHHLALYFLLELRLQLILARFFGEF
jgi:hypothetical protein